MASVTPLRLSAVPRPPSPSASEREVNAWSVKIFTVLNEVIAAIQTVSGNLAIGLEGSTQTVITENLSDNAPVTLTPDGGASAGSGTKASRDDHRHNIQADAPVTIGTANVEGTSTAVARADHIHAGTGITSNQIFLTFGTREVAFS